MREPGAHSDFLRSPHPTSHLAFLVGGLQILDDEPAIPFWEPARQIPPHVGSRDAERIQRHNQLQTAMESHLRASTMRRLSKIIKDDVEPGALEEVLAGDVMMQRRLIKAEERAYPRRTFLWRKPYVSVAALHWLMSTGAPRTKNPTFRAVADRISQGISRREKVRNYEWHQVRRACEAYYSDLARFGATIGWLFPSKDAAMNAVSQLALWQFVPVIALDALHEDVGNLPEFRRLSGASLAMQLDQAIGLGKYVADFADRIDRQE